MTPLSSHFTRTKVDRRRLGIVQRVLTTYRVPFFEKLAAVSEFDVAVFAGQPMMGESIKIADALVNVQRYIANNRYVLKPENMIIWQTNIVKWLCEFNPDVLVMEANPRILSHRQAIRWMHQRRRPILGWGLGELERVGTGVSVALRNLVARKLICSFDGMIAYSTKAKADYMKAGVTSDRIFIAHNSIDNSESEHYMAQLSDLQWVAAWRTNNGLDPHSPIILFVGRLITGKQIDLLIRACMPLFPRCQLLIVGDGPARSDIEQLALPYSSSIHFLGHQTGEALALSFIASDVFVLPGAGGLALHQAMSYGKSVIASFGDGTEADLIRDGQNGLLFRPGDVDDLTDKIETLLSMPERIREMGQDSLAIVRNEINLDRMADSFLLAVETVQSGVSRHSQFYGEFS